MSTDPESIEAPRVRDLTRWGVPFHYAPPLVVAAIGLLLLSVGGAASWIGGWWLAAALPISIGAFLRSRWFALGPVAVWGIWLAISGSAAESSATPQTPAAVAIALAAIGAGATLLAQWAIFPATARDAWEPAVTRLAHLRDADEARADEEADAAANADGDEQGTIEPPDMSQMTLSMDALDPIDVAEHARLMKAVEAGEVDADAPQPAKQTAGTKNKAVVPPPARIEAQPEPEPAGEASEPVRDDTGPAPEPTVERPDGHAEDDVVASPSEAREAADDSPDANAEPAEQRDDPEPADDDASVQPAQRAPVELPLDADPIALDEGGHVTEFQAISEADILAAAEAQAEADQAKADDDAAADDAEAEAETTADDAAAAEASEEAEREAQADRDADDADTEAESAGDDTPPAP